MALDAVFYKCTIFSFEAIEWQGDKIDPCLVNNLPSQNDEFINTDLSALSAWDF